MEIPVTLAAIGFVAAPVLAAVGAIAGIVTKCTLVASTEVEAASRAIQ